MLSATCFLAFTAQILNREQLKKTWDSYTDKPIASMVVPASIRPQAIAIKNSYAVLKVLEIFIPSSLLQILGKSCQDIGRSNKSSTFKMELNRKTITTNQATNKNLFYLYLSPFLDERWVSLIFLADWHTRYWDWPSCWKQIKFWI